MNFSCSRVDKWEPESEKLKVPSVDYSWQMSMTETKIINIWLLPVFPIHLQSQEKSEFSVPFLPQKGPALLGLFSWFSQSRIENRPPKLHNKGGRRRLVLLLLEWNAMQQPSEKEKKKKTIHKLETACFLFLKISKQSQKIRTRSLRNILCRGQLSTIVIRT